MSRQERINTPNGDTFRPGEDYWPKPKIPATGETSEDPKPAVTEAALSIKRLLGNQRLSRTEAQGARIPVKRREENSDG